MFRYICLNILNYWDSTISPFVEFQGFDSYLEKFGHDYRASVLVWRVSDLLNPDGSFDFCLVARPIGWIDSMIKYWSERLLTALENEFDDEKRA